jgi:uncharacterized protein (DUF2141 family)
MTKTKMNIKLNHRKMKKLMLVVAFIGGVYGLSIAQVNNKIVVEVDHINSTKGTVNVAVYNSEKEFLKTPFMSMKKDADTVGLVFEFTGVPNGDYTVSLYHDVNANGELDKNFMGIPDEPYGVSNEGRRMFGPPSYSGALFKIEDYNVRLRISLE